ncbi:MAG: RNA polymerase sigma factor [Ruminococcus sp.]
MNLSEFDELYDRYYLMVMKAAFNILQDYHYAQDICQEVFTLFFVKRETVEDMYIKPWLLVTAKHKAIDFQRKKYHKHEVCGDVLSQNLNIEFDDMEKEFIKKEFRREALAELKKKDRQWYEIIVRVAAAGENQQHVADDLGISLSNLRIKQHRAKLWLRKRFSPEDYSS